MGFAVDNVGKKRSILLHLGWLLLSSVCRLLLVSAEPPSALGDWQSGLATFFPTSVRLPLSPGLIRTEITTQISFIGLLEGPMPRSGSFVLLPHVHSSVLCSLQYQNLDRTFLQLVLSGGLQHNQRQLKLAKMTH